MRKIIVYVILVLVGLTSCAPLSVNQPVITITPSNTTVPEPKITPGTVLISPSKLPTLPPSITPAANPIVITGNATVTVKAPPPGGSQATRDLTVEETSRIFQIVENTPSMQGWLQGRTDYALYFGWYPIIFDGSKIGEWWVPVVGPGAVTPTNVWWYPGVTIAVGQRPTLVLMHIAVDLDAGKTVKVAGPYNSNVMTTIPLNR